MANQSEIARWRRLCAGSCPTHGVGLVQVGVDEERGPIAACPRADCDFAVFDLDRRPFDAVPGESRLAKDERGGWRRR